MGKTRETGVCAKSFSLKKPKFYESNYDVIDSGTDKDGKSENKNGALDTEQLNLIDARESLKNLL